MRQLAFIFMAVFFCFPPHGAQAASDSRFLNLNLKRLYVAGYLGLSLFPDSDYEETVTPVTGVVELKNSNLMAGALGVRLTPEIDIEIELSHRKPDVTSLLPDGGTKVDMGGEIRTDAAMINGYYNFDTPWAARPFITGGLGIAFQNGEFDDTAGVTRDASDSDMGLAWQVGGGVKYRMKKNLSFTTSYRYFATSGLDFGTTHIDYGSHEFRLGIEYDFGIK